MHHDRARYSWALVRAGRHALRGLSTRSKLDLQQGKIRRSDGFFGPLPDVRNSQHA
jgi:hypothetical protein